jgi:hypothetical protein
MKSLLVTLLVVLLFATNCIAQNWHTVGGNNQRNGLTEMFGPDSVVSPFWTVMSNNLSLWGNSVFISGNKFVTSRVNFTPSYIAILECRDIYSGDKLWEKKVYPGSIMYAVGFNEDAVYAHDYSNDTLYALSPYDGSVLWAVKENMFGGNSGITFACNGDPIVKGRRLDKFTGETIWFYDYIVPIGPNSGYAIYGNTFYHFTGSIVTDKKIIALDLETGNLKYESPALPGDSDQEYPITIGSDGTIYLFRDGGNLFAFTDNGSGLIIKWIYDPVGSAVPGYFGSDKNGNIYIVDNDTVKKLSTVDGRVLAKSNVTVMAGFNATNNC